MTQRISLIDYGAGNLHSVHNALKAVGAAVDVTADPEIVSKADRIVLPGVGSFGACMKGLDAVDGLVEALEERVIDDGVPFLGICVGMQLLATRGLEHGETMGLDWIPGEVRRIEQTDPSIKVPHMGWNDVRISLGGDRSELLEQGEAYFLHSYHFVPEAKRDLAAVTSHGEAIAAAVARGNILGVQFHPEKSQRFGLSLLTRFMEWQP